MKTNRRVRWRPLIALAAVMALGAAGSCLWKRKPPQRKEFIGQVDKATGYRCRFSLSSDWRQVNPKLNIYLSNDEMSVDCFSPPPPNPIHAWIVTHLFHQVVPSGEEPTINLLTPRISEVQVFQIQAGYPELIGQTTVQLSHFTHRHLRIDGFPATVVTESNKSDSATFLLVYIPDHSVSYRVTGSGTSYNAAETNREMQAIIATFHVEKVVPAGGVR